MTPRELPADAGGWLGPRIEATRKNGGAWTLFAVPERLVAMVDDIETTAKLASFDAYAREFRGNWSLTLRSQGASKTPGNRPETAAKARPPSG